MEAQVGLASGCNFYAGFAENISEGGLFIATEAPLFLGDRISLTVAFGEATVTAAAEVMWLRRSAETGLPDGMGLRFIALDQSSVGKINQFIAANREDVLFYEN